MAGDDPALLELLHALGQQAVAELGDGLRDLGEAQTTAMEQDVEDRAGPALADELYRLVVAGTAAGPGGGLFEGRSLRAPPGAHAIRRRAAPASPRRSRRRGPRRRR